MEIKTYEEIFADLPEDASFYDKAFARRTHKAFLNDPKTKAEIVHRDTILNNIKTHLNNDNYGGAFSDATNNLGTLASIGRDEVREFFKTTNFKEPVQEGASAIGNFLLGFGKGILPGANKFASEFNETFVPGFNEIVSPWLAENIPEINTVNESIDNVLKTEGGAQEAGFGFGEITGQVVLPGGPLTKGAKAVGVASNFMSRVLGYGAAEVIGMPPEEISLIEMGIDYMAKDGELKTAIMDSLSADEDLPTFLQKIQRLPIRMTEGGILGETVGKGFESIGALYRLMKASPQADALKSGIVQAGENAQTRLDAGENTTTMSSMGGGEIDKAIDTGIAKVGQQFADSQARYFQTGRFEPPTAEAPVSIVRPTETEPGIIAFHGSGADFDKFELGMINTGEGAQAFGHGLYFTDSEDIATFYRDAMNDRNSSMGFLPIKYQGKRFKDFDDSPAADADPDKYRMINALGKEIKRLSFSPVLRKPETAKNQLLAKLDADIAKQETDIAAGAASDVGNGDTLENLILQSLIIDRDALMRIDAADITIEETGKMYKVGLAPQLDELIDYDAPLSAQSNKVKEALKPIYEKYELPEYEPFFALQTKFPGFVGNNKVTPSMLSEELSNAGLKGIKYRSSNSRTQSTGSAKPEQNYVIFDDSMIKIMEKYGIVGPVAITSLAATQNGEQDG
tara:strand:- start:4329 stop:6377 length:2049 start_codon:yes stop_codon:yes gene_type:complete